ncbi:MAG: MFS transporter [Phycisphaerae bacterium]|nr:MFS transporter [Phycisphaerae bacterium]
MSAPRRASCLTLRNDLRACTKDGITHSLMVGVGETFIPAFALAAGAAQVHGGLVYTIPFLVGATVQLLTPAGVDRIGSPRKWVLLCATIQALCFIPMAIAAMAGAVPLLLVYVCASIYWAVNLGAAPAWNAWVGALFPERIRASYFSRRSRVCQIALLAGLLLGGVVISRFEHTPLELASFAVLFMAASLSRALSTPALVAQSEPKHLPPARRVNPIEFLQRIRGAPEGRVVAALLVFMLTVQVSSPFATPYMLRALAMDNDQFTISVVALFAAKCLVLPVVGRLAASWGARRLLMAGAIVVAAGSGAWIVSTAPGWIYAMQVVSGAGWAAYEMALFLLLLEHIREEERTAMYAAYYFFNAVVTVIGSFVGAAAIDALGGGVTAYWWIFGASSLLRFAAIPLMFRIPRHGHERSAPVMAIDVGTEAGALDEPVIAARPVPEVQR